MHPKEKILVLSVDRDDDIGRKAGVKGPVVGREGLLKAAQGFAIADPTDSDANAMFQAIKTTDELSNEFMAEVALLTGDTEVGVKSDKKISDQLREVLREFPADAAVLVSDGAEDEHVIPIIQSHLPIISVNRLVVHQAEELESSYFKIKDFINESLENPKYARLIFGLPAIILILGAVFGAEGWRAIIGILGAYLLIKGFKLEKYVYNALDELKTSFTRRRFAFFVYIVGIAFSAIAAYRGYTALQDWLSEGIFECAASFVNASIYYFYLGGVSAWLGRAISKRKEQKKGGKIIAIPLFGLAISVVIYTTSGLMLTPEISLLNFLMSLGIGFGLLVLALLIEWKG
jgi:putative membrane protein